MSLHVEQCYCDHRPGRGSGETFWVAACECGWTGVEVSCSRNSNAASIAKRDYREHIEAALGADAYIDAPVKCRNCGMEGSQGILVGTHVMSNACARCGQTMLSPDNEAWNEDRSRMRWF